MEGSYQLTGKYEERKQICLVNQTTLGEKLTRKNLKYRYFEWNEKEHLNIVDLMITLMIMEKSVFETFKYTLQKCCCFFKRHPCRSVLFNTPLFVRGEEWEH